MKNKEKNDKTIEGLDLFNGVQINPGEPVQIPTEPKKTKKKHGCLRFFIVIACIIFFFIFLAAVFYGAFLIDLPNVSDLRSKASQFETMRILDRQGNLLYEIVPPEAGRRDYVTLDEISSYVLASVISVEDQDYYEHPGFDIIAIIRAVFQNVDSGQTVSGASTITQQLARNLLLSRQERSERTVSRKIREIILAAEITRRYSKDEILEIYLNENYYGNHAYGIEAAAQTYFKKSARNLDFAQAAFLAGLPQAPGYYDIFNNREATLARLKTVLLLTFNNSAEKGCIPVRSGAECIRIDPLMVNNAVSEIESYAFTPGLFNIRYPHWVSYVYSMLEDEYGADALYRSGFTVYTTLDPDMQDMAEQELRSQINSLSGVNVHNGAVVIMQPSTGDILAMVGSPDFEDAEHAGQVNMAVSPRQPGSSIKPLIYASAFEKGWTPATLIWDVDTLFSPNGKPEELAYSAPYHPTNYDGQFHGPVLAREALASSLNIPAVKALQFVGIYDDPGTEAEEGFIPFARRMHVRSLDKAGWGLSIALGGGEVTLLELTNAYTVFANNGKYIPSRAVLRITDHTGQVVYEAGEPLIENALNEEYAYQISSILSDDAARSLGFGAGSILNLTFPAAVKTGTTNDYRDNWTIGYNHEIAVGVWVGNADNQPMTGSTGVTGAAPVWHSTMEKAAAMYPQIRSGQFVRPAGITDAMVCAVSGTMPGPECREVKWEVFARYQPPLSEKDGLIQQYYVDTWSGKLASAECAFNAELKSFLNVKEPEAQAWIKGTEAGRRWAENNQCADLEFMPSGEILMPPCNYPVLDLIAPSDGTALYEDQTDIVAVAYANDGIFEYSLSFASAASPDNWYVIADHLYAPVFSPAKIGEWYLGNLESGDYLLRLRMTRNSGQYFDRTNIVHIEHQEQTVIESDHGYIHQGGQDDEVWIGSDSGDIYRNPNDPDLDGNLD